MTEILFARLDEVITDAELSALVLLKANNLSDIADASVARTNLGLAIGTNVQAWDAQLDTWAGVTPASGIATFLATPSSANLRSALTDETGSGVLVFAGGNIGAATATSLNGLTISSSTGTLTVANGKTATISNTLTFTGTDASSVAFGAGGTVVYPTAGSWTPDFTFTTPGDLAKTLSLAYGYYYKIGALVTVTFYLTTSSFTHTTASGSLTMTGLPFTSQNAASDRWRGTMQFSGITKAGYTNFTVGPNSNATTAIFVGSGSGVGASAVSAADMPSGGAILLQGSLTYVAAS